MIDLSQFVDKNVTVTLRMGAMLTGSIELSGNRGYPFRFDFKALNNTDSFYYYTASGDYFVSRPTDHDIVAIEEIEPVIAEVEVPTLSELEVRKTQLEVELEEVERQIRVANGPDGFSASEVFNFLQTEARESVSLMFSWSSTPQGYAHWGAIRAGDKKVSREDIEYLMNCLSKHFLRKFE